MKGSDSRDAKSSHFVALIGDQPLKTLKALTLKPYRGLSRATATLPTKERNGNYNGKGNVEPIIQINFHHSKNALAIITRSMAVVQICIAIVQELWLVKGCIRGLGISCKVFKANTANKMRACVVTKGVDAISYS